jgi:hypothetical protein
MAILKKMRIEYDKLNEYNEWEFYFKLFINLKIN